VVNRGIVVGHENFNTVVTVISPHGIAMPKGLYFAAVVFRSSLPQGRFNKAGLVLGCKLSVHPTQEAAKNIFL